LPNPSADPDYKAALSGLTYYVGASLFGATIHGYSVPQSCDPAKLTTGVATTTGGIAPIRITYPADIASLQLGCLNNPSVDARFPNNSGQVIIAASANETNDVQESGATLISRNKFCYAPTAPITLTPFPSSMGAGTRSFSITFIDDGLVPVPYVENVTCSPVITSNPSHTMSISILSTNPTTADQNGVATFTVSISGGGGSVPDSGSILCYGYNGTTSIGVTVP
ncbi:MAG: hypothetical protein HQL95_15925, partial [Magnetococcales bacterium]|nr:hypothetical protein [Magnetococcales bacterium]